MDELKFNELRDANLRRCRRHYHHEQDWSLTDWLTAVAGEVGELAHIIKDIRRSQTPTFPLFLLLGAAGRQAAIAEEAADVVIYLDLLCAKAGIDLGKAVREKFNLVSRERLEDCNILLEETDV